MFKLIKARQLGAICYWDYFTLSHNPFVPDSEKFCEWEYGWYEARTIDNEDV